MRATPFKAELHSGRGLEALLFLFVAATFAFGQSDTGTLRLAVVDPTGVPIPASVQIVSASTQVHDQHATNSMGELVRRSLPYGIYTVHVSHPGFAVSSRAVEIHSRIPLALRVRLEIAPVASDVLVTDSATLVDPQSTGKVEKIGAATLDKRLSSLPGRSLINLVSSQPGWVLESNASLHPRGSEYQVQYVVDGIPLTENRSPAFAPGINADDVQSMTVLTGNFPAEYGRKLGGVIAVSRKTAMEQGLHGEWTASGGSFHTAGGYAALSYGWGRSALSLSGDDQTTDRYLDPPVLQNYTNHGITGSQRVEYERQIRAADRLTLSMTHQKSAFEVPDELLQQQAGQLQSRTGEDTMGIAGFEHVISPNALADFRFLFRDVSAGLSSNQYSTPVIAAQQRKFREAYGKGTVSVQRGMHNLKAGFEVDYSPIEERFTYQISDPSFFDPSTPANFLFHGHGIDREVAAFVEDAIHVGQWSVSAGIRYDHYQLVVDRAAFSPRLGIGWYSKRANLNLHASYDRVFETPAAENLLLSSSPIIQRLDSQVLSLPVEPSTGNYWDFGITKGIVGQARLSVDYYRRAFANYADDDVLLDTGISFPISFRKGQIYGAEAKLDLPRWKKLSGFLSYSYMVGFGYTPVTGGLFLGNEASSALINSGRFPVTQDQRNTVNARGIVQLTPRLWISGGAAFGSGLPTEFDGTYADAIQQYGKEIVERVNFARGRVLPSVEVNASAGVELYKGDRMRLNLQADGQNLNNRTNVINFAGLFSGTGIAAPRSFAIQLQGRF